MTPEEFRKHGHAVVDWIADYRARVADAAGDGARPSPAQIKAQLPARAARAGRAVRGDPPRSRPHRHARPLALAASRTSSATSPATATLGQRARRLRQHRPRRARPRVAVEPGADRSGRGRHRLAAPDGRPLRRLERRHPGHGVDQHAASRCSARASGRTELRRWRAAACRPKRSRWSSTPRPTPTARWTRRRCWPASAATTSATSPYDERYAHAPRRAGRGDRRRSRGGTRPCAIVATTGTTTTTALDPVGRDRARSPGARRCGCTSMRRWPARR